VSEYAWLEKACGMYDSGNQKDGDILSHDWLRFALDIPKPKNLGEAEEVQWLALARIEAFKEWLLVERKTALKSVRGKGYWIVPPEEQAQVAAEEAMKLVQKGLERGSRMMEHARTELMDNDSRKRHTDAQVRLLGVGQMMKGQKRDVLRLFKPS
jgi:hypothetical protein